MVIQFKLDDRGVRGATAWLRGIRTGIEDGLSTPALMSASINVTNVLEQELEDSANRSFRNQTGRLVRSFVVRFSSRNDGFDVGLFSNLPYAAIQERGGVIRPRNARMLTIPLNAIARSRRARDFPKLHRRGNALFLGNVAMYALKPMVTIPPTRYLSTAMRNARPRIRRIFKDATRQLARDAQDRRE